MLSTVSLAKNPRLWSSQAQEGTYYSHKWSYIQLLSKFATFINRLM